MVTLTTAYFLPRFPSQLLLSKPALIFNSSRKRKVLFARNLNFEPGHGQCTRLPGSRNYENKTKIGKNRPPLTHAHWVRRVREVLSHHSQCSAVTLFMVKKKYRFAIYCVWEAPRRRPFSFVPFQSALSASASVIMLLLFFYVTCIDPA